MTTFHILTNCKGGQQHKTTEWGLHTSRGVFSGKPALLVSKGKRSGSFQCCLAKHLPRKLRLSLTGSYSLKKSRNSSLSIARMGLPSMDVSRYRRSSDWLWGRAKPLGFSCSHADADELDDMQALMLCNSGQAWNMMSHALLGSSKFLSQSDVAQQQKLCRARCRLCFPEEVS